MKALLLDTISELTSRKVMILFAVITVILLLGVWATWQIREDLLPQPDRSGSEAVSQLLEPWVATAFSKIVSVFIFFAVLASAGLMPRALEKGRAEFFLSKPLSRTRLLLGKLLSVWLAYGAMVFGSALIVYGVAAVVHGVFDMRILLLFAVYAVDFLVWVSIVGLAGVLSGSASWAITAAFGVWIAQWLLSFHDAVRQLTNSSLIRYFTEALYYLFPKTGQLGDTAVSLAVGQPVESWLPLWSTLLFAAAMMCLAVLVFRRQDY